MEARKGESNSELIKITISNDEILKELYSRRAKLLQSSIYKVIVTKTKVETTWSIEINILLNHIDELINHRIEQIESFYSR